MDHLRDPGFMAVRETEDVQWVLSKQDSDIANLFRRTTFGYNEFVLFLEDRGWTADEKNGFRLQQTARKKEKEPERKDSAKKTTESKKNGVADKKSAAKANPLPAYNEVEILQAWLFFALIASVVRKDKEPARSRIGRGRHGGQTVTSDTPLVGEHENKAHNQGGDTIPILSLGDLLTGNSPRKYLTTEKLLSALQECHDCIKAMTPKAKLRARLIEIDRTLELARRVVRANIVPKALKPHDNGPLAGAPLKTLHNDNKGETNGNHHVDSSQNGVDPLGNTLGPKLTQQAEAPHNKEFPELSLCLMVLGETLSAAKLQLMNDLGLRMNGWLVDDDDGWGPPSFILNKMEKSWCPRASAVMQGQLGFSAILLSTAFQVRQKKPTDRKEHLGCNTRQCYHVPGVESSGKFYPPQHHPNQEDCANLNKRKECRLLGPHMPKLYEILKDATPATEASNFPILRIVSRRIRNDSGNEAEVRRVLGVTVERWSLETLRKLRKPHFTAISHVWSQGMGNERHNKLHECQLELILTTLLAAEAQSGGEMNHESLDKRWSGALFDQIDKDYHEDEIGNYHLSPPFWMDTLAIPVSQDKSQLDFKDLKARAIRQIYHVFNSASRVVVIDKELAEEWALQPFHTILKVLTSAWMQRLWTLQEAFLSRNLLVTFRSKTRDPQFDGLTFESSGLIQVDLQNLDNLIRQLDRPQNAHTTAMAELIKRKFFHNLMGEDREIRNRNDHPVETRGSMVIASAWRSSRWRNTSRLEDETLALSTLLNLDYRETKIEATVKDSAVKESSAADSVQGSTTKSSKERDERERSQRLEGMMQDFWALIHKNYEGSIPAGLIFLPGEKMTGTGFGWAPKTWMSASDEYYPYPLGIPSKPTELHIKDGLLVQYPGFLLQCGHPNTILGSNLAKSTLTFPIDQSMSEWYQVKALEDTRTGVGTPQMLLSKSHGSSHLEFGIILSRPRPREWPEEIGLLVHIYREVWKRKEPERISRNYFYCQIVRHVWVSRTTAPPELKEYRLPSGKMGDHPIGEAVPEDTLWYVDGYQANRDKPQPNPDTPTGTPNSADAKVPLERRNDAFQAMAAFQGIKRTLSFGGPKTSSPQLDRASTSFVGKGVPSIAETGAVTPNSQDLEAQRAPRTPESTTPEARRWGIGKFWSTPTKGVKE